MHAKETGEGSGQEAGRAGRESEETDGGAESGSATEEARPADESGESGGGTTHKKSAGNPRIDSGRMAEDPHGIVSPCY